MPKQSYVQRMEDELTELNDKRRKLKYFLKGNSPAAKELPANKRKLMEEQLNHMESYKAVLIQRIELER